MLTLPGHPEGEAFNRIESAAEWVADRIGEDAGSVAVVGHSMGGQIALQLAHDHPSLVDGVVVVASGARIMVPQRSVDGIRTAFAEQCERFVGACYLVPNPDDVARDLDTMRAVGADSILRDYAAVDAWDGRPLLAAIRQPALVISGEDDAVTPPGLGQALAEALPNAIGAIVPGARHFVMLEQHESVNLLIAGFLARVELGSHEE